MLNRNFFFFYNSTLKCQTPPRTFTQEEVEQILAIGTGGLDDQQKEEALVKLLGPPPIYGGELYGIDGPGYAWQNQKQPETPKRRSWLSCFFGSKTNYGGKKKSPKSLDTCTVDELKARAVKRGIKVTGLKKAEILAKLRR